MSLGMSLAAKLEDKNMGKAQQNLYLSHIIQPNLPTENVESTMVTWGS